MLLHKKLLLKFIIDNKWFTLKFFKLLWNKTIVDYWGIEYTEIIIWHFSYHTPYQPVTPISAAQGLKWVEGWYGVWYEKCHIIIYLSYIFFFKIYFAFPSADNNFLILPSRLTNGFQFQL